MNNPFLGVVRNEMQAGNYWSGVGVRVESSLRETAGHGEEVPYGKQVLRTECKGGSWDWARIWEIMPESDHEAVREGSEHGLWTQ